MSLTGSLSDLQISIPFFFSCLLLKSGDLGWGSGGLRVAGRACPPARVCVCVCVHTLVRGAGAAPAPRGPWVTRLKNQPGTNLP